MLSELDDIRAEASRLSQEDLVEPSEPIESDETVVDEISEDLRKVFSLFVRYQQDLVFNQQDSEKHKKSDYILHLFWVTCFYRFPVLRDKPGVSIKKGWKLVYVESAQLPEKLYELTPEKAKKVMEVINDEDENDLTEAKSSSDYLH